MNNLLKLKSTFFYILAFFFITSCSTDSNEDIIIDPDDDTSEFDGELSVFETGADNRTVVINGSDLDIDADASVKVSFSSTSNMKRLYVTQDVSGFGAEAYDLAIAGITIDDKADGSIDLSGDNENEFSFEIPFVAPSNSEGSIVYTLWATTGRGDFRDVTKRNAIADDDINAVGTITINGTGTNDGTGIHTYSQTLLAAPLADGSSGTFMSVYNNEVYKISEGEELAALWDFGFYYLPGAAHGASLASASDYPELFDHDGDQNTAPSPTPLVAVSRLSGVDQAELNHFYFAISSKTSADFDAVTSSADLNDITTPTSERANNLDINTNNIVEFVDQYGNKGLIRITDKKDSFGFDGFITFDIKVQY